MTIALIVLLALVVSAIVSVLVGRWFANQRAAQKVIDDYVDQVRAAWESGAEPPWENYCHLCGTKYDLLREEENGARVLYGHRSGACTAERWINHVISGFTKGA